MALVTKNFSDIITFTRASTATFFNSSGVLTSAGNNVPRFDYNPSTLAPLGLLIEEQRTNSLLYSEQFNNVAGWTAIGTAPTVTANTATSPDGTLNADTVTFAAADSRLQNNLVLSFTAGVSYTFTVYVKAVGASLNKIRLAFFDGAQQNSTDFTVSNSTWTRITSTFVAANTTAVGRVQIRNATDNLANSLYLWGAQLEAGAFPTSYIPTTTTALTRSADAASVNTLSPWFNATEGTLFAEWTAQAFTHRPATFNDGTQSNAIALVASATNIGSNVYVSNVFQGTAGVSGTFTTGTTYKQATAYKLNDTQDFANGVAATTDTTISIPTVTQLLLGAGRNGMASTPGNGWLRRFTYYPRRLSQAEGIAITA